jgi:Helix-turn-helix domain
LLTLAQVAERRGGVTTESIRQLICRGRLRAGFYRVPRGKARWLVAPADLDAFIAAGPQRPGFKKRGAA